MKHNNPHPLSALLLTIALSFAIVSTTTAQDTIEIKNLRTFFRKHNLKGTILIFDKTNNHYQGHNIDQCTIGFLPASTFKIPHTLIALETQVANPDTLFSWNGEKREMQQWEQDMTLCQAFQLSCVPIYQALARAIGPQRMQEYLLKLHFGQMNLTPHNLDNFWLAGNSTITPFEQIDFLTQLVDELLPLSPSTMQEVKSIMLREQRPSYTIRGKTGLSNVDGQYNGWFVGYVERGSDTYFFATNVYPLHHPFNKQKFLSARIELTKEILRHLQIIPQ